MMVINQATGDMFRSMVFKMAILVSVFLIFGCSPDPDNPEGLLSELRLSTLGECEFRVVLSSEMNFFGASDYDLYAVCRHRDATYDSSGYFYIADLNSPMSVEIAIDEYRSLRICSVDSKNSVEERLERLRNEYFVDLEPPLFDLEAQNVFPCPFEIKL